MDSGTRIIDDKLRGLSTSEVAALIAFGTFAGQLLLSFIWPLILVGFISEREAAVTWSVASRIIHNSYWPTVLQTDATATSGVKRRVSVVSYGTVLGAILIGVAGIVTPLGLYEGIFPSDDATPVQFKYAPDSSALGLGLGTAPRHDSLGFSRICYDEDGLSGVCPHSYQDLPTTSNSTFRVADGYDTRIPKNTYEFFQSGVSRLGRSVSSLFDIEYRTYKSVGDSASNSTQGTDKYLVGDYRQLTSVLLDDDLAVVEGLVVDTKAGGVGFRNHTVPAEDLEYGGQWEEDILFIEPVSECVDTNLTLRFRIPDNSSTGDMVENVVLVDSGGFVDLEREFRTRSDMPAQEDLDLAYRAYAGAWVNNGWTMLYLNITNPNNESTGEESFSYVESEKGRRFSLPVSEDTKRTNFDVKSISVNPYLKALNLPSRDIGNDSIINPEDLAFVPPNPWDITSDNFTDMRGLCQGALSGDDANIENVAGMCGLVTAIPQRTDSPDSVLVEPGSEWDVQLHHCASASRAILKTVSFSVNSTGLSGLRVTGVAEKEYRDDSEYPIWAVEDSETKLGSARQLWGLAESEDAPFGSVSFKRHPYLWLNGANADISHTASGDDSENLPGAYFHGMALGVAYSIGWNEKYTGVESQSIYNRWNNLTKTTEGTAKLINLVWTDVAANAVVGTRSQLPKDEPPGLGPAYDVNEAENQKRADSNGDVRVPINILHRRVKYKLPYAVPAFIVLGVILGAVGFGFVALVFRGATPRRIRSFLMRLSAGRIMTATLLPEDNVKGDAPAEKWLDRKGRVPVDISGRTPRVDDGSTAVDDGESTEGKGVTPGKGVDPASRMLEETATHRNGGRAG